MQHPAKNRSLVCGIGNPMLKDDRAGIEVAERIERSGLPVDVEIIYGVGFEVNDKIMGYDDVIIIDAAKIGYPAGTITEVTVDDIFSDHKLASSHAMTLGSTLKVGYQLFPEEMPARLRILLIEAEDYYEFTRECSSRVEEAIGQVVEMIHSHFTARQVA
jgi:hydrogenase maturation protease